MHAVTKNKDECQGGSFDVDMRIFLTQKACDGEEEKPDAQEKSQ